MAPDYNSERARHCSSRCGRPVLSLACASRPRSRRSKPRPSDRHERRSAGRHRRHHHFRRTAKRHRSRIAARASVDSLDGRTDPRHLLRPSIAGRNNARWHRQAELFEGIRVGEVAAEVSGRAEALRYRRSAPRHRRTLSKRRCAVRWRSGQQPGVGEPRRLGGEAAGLLRGAGRHR